LKGSIVQERRFHNGLLSGIGLQKKTSRAVPILSVCLLAALTGCSSNSTTDKFIPNQMQAREALEAALNAWVEGKKPGGIEGTPIPVQAADSQWSAGMKLVSFEIIEQVEGEVPPAYIVQLTMQGRSEPLKVRYYVVGKDPLWVYREDNFKASKGM
jgi:hypothetical protein